MQMLAAKRLLWLLGLSLMWPGPAVTGSSERRLRELLTMESSLIEALRDYIVALDQQLAAIKSETAAIEQIHQQVGSQVEEYMGNPLNVLTILKRFESAWPLLERRANETQQLAESLPENLFELDSQLPSEEEYEAALLNLLRLQSVYDLQPAALSAGIVHGLKLGSAMSWSDCLEMARTWDRHGDHAVAKYWLETAQERLSAEHNGTASVGEQEQGRMQILETSLSMDFRAGEFSSALRTAEELLLLRPGSQKVKKTLATIERAAKKSPRRKSRTKLSKSAGQQLVEELCRSGAQQLVAGSRFAGCRQEVANLHMLRLEQLSADPHVMLYHDVLTLQQTEQLIGMLKEMMWSKSAGFDALPFSKPAQSLLCGIHNQLGTAAGAAAPQLWQARRHSHEHVTQPEEPREPEEPEGRDDLRSHTARALLNLQEARLGGAVVFPQLELSVRVPRGGLLYWTTRSPDEHPASPSSDYRSRQLVCPVLLGAQLSAWTALD